MQLPTIDEAGVLAVGLCERLLERDQAMFIAGFQEAIKFLMVIVEKRLDTGNLADDVLYIALDNLYNRGWVDKHKNCPYDPRGTKDWQEVLDLFRQKGRLRY